MVLEVFSNLNDSMIAHFAFVVQAWVSCASTDAVLMAVQLEKHLETDPTHSYVCVIPS